MTRSNDTLNVLRVDASARGQASTSRQLGDALLSHLQESYHLGQVTTRDVSKGLPFVDAAWVAANSTPAEERDAEMKAALGLSDQLVGELQQADILVITTPIYNFGIPATLKAWVDQIARARLTFRYTQNGPVGLLTGKKAYVVIASGGTGIGSEIDFASGYLRHVLGFVGITDVEIVSADRQMSNAQAVEQAEAQIAELGEHSVA